MPAVPAEQGSYQQIFARTLTFPLPSRLPPSRPRREKERAARGEERAKEREERERQKAAEREEREKRRADKAKEKEEARR